jgi:hypothetical protein
MDRVPRLRTPRQYLGAAAGLAVAANYVPATVTLGQWGSLRVLPQ